MAHHEIERVLRNWIEEALVEAEGATDRLRARLRQVGSSPLLDEALHESTHVRDALADLRSELGLEASGP